MSHRVHPKSYRLRGIDDWDSRWFSKKNLSQYLEEDFHIREFIMKKLEKAGGVEKIEIERFPGKIKVGIFSARPGLIIGRGGEGVENLRKQLFLQLSRKALSNSSYLLSSKNFNNENKDKKLELKLEIKEVRNPWFSASLSAQWMAQQIEKRIQHRRVLKQSLDKIIITKGVEGARVEIAGRLGGSDIARREWLKKGRLPRQTIRADIDYGQARANCSYGVIGIKVWIYKGEKF